MKKRLLAASFAAAAWLTATAQAQPIYNGGHADIGVEYEDGEFKLHYHFHSGEATYEAPHIGSATGFIADDFGDEEFAPSGAFTRVPDPSALRPAGSQWDFIGATAGSPYWFLPQTFDSNKPFLGWASEELEPGDWTGPLTFSLTGLISAPPGGQVSLWQIGFDPDDPTRLWDSQDGDFSNDLFNTIVGGHDHAVFGFTAPGVYQIEITASGVHSTDGFVTGSSVFTFLVGDGTLTPSAVPEPSGIAAMLIAALLAGFGAWRTRRAPAMPA